MMGLATVWARWRSDRRGVSAVEFAFIAPILFLFYFATIEISLLLSVDRKLTNTVSTLADLVAQVETVDADEMNGVFAAATAVMEPFGSGDLEMRVSSVGLDTNQDPVVLWSSARNTDFLECDASPPVPEDILVQGDTVIMAEIDLNYVSPIGRFLDSARQLEKTFYMRPRRTTEIVFEPDPCGS